MKTRNTWLQVAVFGCVAIAPLTTMAAAPSNNDVLIISEGVVSHNNYGYVSDITSGSYFAMDTNGNGIISGSEKVALSQGTTGLVIGVSTTPGASHSGQITADDTNAITAPWSFFGSTGSDYVTVGVTGNTADGLDFSGWAVTWNGIPAIPLGGLAWQPVNCASLGCAGVFNDGVAHFSWSGFYGDSYSLDYTASVPNGDPSGFGGIRYYLHFEGIVSQDGSLPPTSNISIISPAATLECTSPDGAVIEAGANINTTDANDIVSVNWSLDGISAGSGNTVSVLASIGSHTLSLAVDTVESGSFQVSKSLLVRDSARPNLDINFIDNRSGDEITVIDSKGRHFVTVDYVVSDVCDAQPTATGTASVAHTINDGDVMSILNRNIAETTLGSSAVTVNAQAVDASGNRSSTFATLQIID